LPDDLNWYWRFRASPNGKEMAISGGRGSVHCTLIWDLVAGRVVTQLPIQEQVTGLAFSSDGALLATCDVSSGNVTVWERATGWKPGFHSRDKDQECGEVAFSPDDHLLAVAGAGDNAAVWHLATKRKRVLGKLPNLGRNIAFSADGKWLVATDFISAIKVWDVAAGAEHLSVDAHVHPRTGRTGVQGALFVPDGRTLLTAGTDGMVRFWDVPAKRQLDPLPGGIGEVEAMALTRDGKVLALGSGRSNFGAREGGTVRVWDLKRRKELATIKDLPSGVTCLDFTPDGRWLIASTGGPHGKMVAWRVQDLLQGRGGAAEGNE
jgi:WD40 repeat protein